MLFVQWDGGQNQSSGKPLGVAGRGNLIRVSLWESLWGIILIGSLNREDTLTRAALFPGQGSWITYKGESKLNASVDCSQLPDRMWPAPAAMMDGALELWANASASFPNLLVSGYLFHSNKESV